MKGLFCAHCKAKNNEEYREVLKKRLVRVRLLGTAGILMVLGMRVLFSTLWKETDGHRQSFIYGMGTGLMLGSMIAIFRIRRFLANEELLKRQRLKETDERELEIGNLALRQTAKLMLALFYVLMIFSILVSRELLYVCCLLIGIFLLSYMVFRRYYENKV